MDDVPLDEQVVRIVYEGVCGPRVVFLVGGVEVLDRAGDAHGALHAGDAGYRAGVGG